MIDSIGFHELKRCISGITGMDNKRKIVFLCKLPLCKPPILLIFYLFLCFLTQVKEICWYFSSISPIDIVKVKSTLPYCYHDIAIILYQFFELLQCIKFSVISSIPEILIIFSEQDISCFDMTGTSIRFCNDHFWIC